MAAAATPGQREILLHHQQSQAPGCEKAVAATGGTPLTGYSIVDASDLTAAAALAKGCPLADGGTVDIYEALAM